MKKKIILVLGATGQDGSLIVKYLLKKNFKVHGLVRKSATGNLANIKTIINHPNFIIHHGDLLDLISIEKIIRKVKPDEIYNFADQDHVRWSFEIPSYSFDVTGGAVIKILEIVNFNILILNYIKCLRMYSVSLRKKNICTCNKCNDIYNLYKMNNSCNCKCSKCKNNKKMIFKFNFFFKYN